MLLRRGKSRSLKVCWLRSTQPRPRMPLRSAEQLLSTVCLPLITRAYQVTYRGVVGEAASPCVCSDTLECQAALRPLPAT